MSVQGVPFNVERRKQVNRLADGLIPLASWINKPDKFVPPGVWPWRIGETLNAEHLGFDRFLEALLLETSEDADLKARWDEFAANPLRLCPTPDVTSWRKARGLDDDATFAAVVSDNVIVDIESRMVSRGDFYAPFWPLLEVAYLRADSIAEVEGNVINEIEFAAQLLTDSNVHWPGAGGLERASRFCKQFVKDILYCYLGLRNPEREPWGTAVLTELGEHRRVGNKFGPTECEEAVATFNRILAELRAKKVELMIKKIPKREFFAQPVGSPPVNARDL